MRLDIEITIFLLYKVAEIRSHGEYSYYGSGFIMSVSKYDWSYYYWSLYCNLTIVVIRKYLKSDKSWSIVWIFAMAPNFSYFVQCLFVQYILQKPVQDMAYICCLIFWLYILLWNSSFVLLAFQVEMNTGSDDDVRFVLYQHAELDFYTASALKIEAQWSEPVKF
jgi:hypothetical protein